MPMSLCCGILTVPACGLELTPDSSYSLKTSIYNTTGCHAVHHQTQPAKGKNIAKPLRFSSATLPPVGGKSISCR